MFLTLFPFVCLVLGDLPISSTRAPRDTSPNHLLVLVNKSNQTELDADYQPDDLVDLDQRFMVYGHRGSLRKEAAAALSSMLIDVRRGRRSIRVRSAFRSYKTQGKVFRAKIRKYGERKARSMSAQAGHSQHQLGTTVDLTFRSNKWKFSQSQPKAPAGRWLKKNAHRYGFVLSYPRGKRKLTGYIHEPWHYRYIGVAAATEMYKADIPLESYLRVCSDESAELRCPSSR